MSEQPNQPSPQPGNATESRKVKTILYASIVDSAVSYSLVPEDDHSAKKFKDGHIWLKKDSGAHDVHFRLVDGTDSGLHFDPDPIWVEDNGSCPPGPAKGSSSKQVTCPAGQSGASLKIVDRNDGDPVRLCYQLNIVDKNGVNHPFDPIIINDGGIWIPPPVQ